MDAQLAFLARQLMATELHGTAEDLPGGVLAQHADGTWLGLWDFAHMGDPEALNKQAQAAAQAAGATLRGAVVLTPPAGDPRLAELAEALYVYGYEPAPGPESVMVLGSAPHPRPHGLRIESSAEVPADLPEAFRDSIGELGSPTWSGLPTGAEYLATYLDTQLVGAIAVYGTPLVTRVIGLWTDPAHKDKDVLPTLVERCAADAQAAGKLLTCAWARRSGLLRFDLAAAGFAEQLSAHYFAAT